MIPKWVAVLWFGVPIGGTWLYLLVLAPWVGITEKALFRRGELYMLFTITMWYVFIAALVFLRHNNEEPKFLDKDGFS